jgi:Arc/MetJ family transcription regulator
MHGEACMRTTLDLPEELLAEAMALTHISTKTDLIKTALQSLIQKEKSKSIKEYFGKISLDIDLNSMRKR